MRNVVRMFCVLVAAFFLAGCTLNRVKFSEPLPPTAANFRPITAVHDMCEVESQLALYVDSVPNLWVDCPYRYQGELVHSMGYVGPKPNQGATDFSYGSAIEKMKTMRNVKLLNCGRSRYCADLSALGYLDFAISYRKNHAEISYVDASHGFKEVENFYAALQTRNDKLVLDPNLRRLVDLPKVAVLINEIDALGDLSKAETLLSNAGIQNMDPVRRTADSRRQSLQISAFRQQNDFVGFSAAYDLTKDSWDLGRMQTLAQSAEQKSAVFAALIQSYKTQRNDDALAAAAGFITTAQERTDHDAQLKIQAQEKQAEVQRQKEERLAEQRKQEEARLTERRKQEEDRKTQARKVEDARIAEQRAAQALAAEARCMRDAACRQAVEQRQAQCVQKIGACRKACDNVTGAGGQSSFFGGLVASGLARACYSACKCESGAGDLIEKFERATKKGG